MKTKLNRFGKSSLSIVLAVMMLFSSMIAASNQTVDAAERAIEAATGVSAEQDAAVEHDDSASQPKQTAKAVKPVKKTPEASGAAGDTWYVVGGYGTNSWNADNSSVESNGVHSSHIFTLDSGSSTSYSFNTGRTLSNLNTASNENGYFLFMKKSSNGTKIKYYSKYTYGNKYNRKINGDEKDTMTTNELSTDTTYQFVFKNNVNNNLDNLSNVVFHIDDSGDTPIFRYTLEKSETISNSGDWYIEGRPFDSGWYTNSETDSNSKSLKFEAQGNGIFKYDTGLTLKELGTDFSSTRPRLFMFRKKFTSAWSENYYIYDYNKITDSNKDTYSALAGHSLATYQINFKNYSDDQNDDQKVIFWIKEETTSGVTTVSFKYTLETIQQAAQNTYTIYYDMTNDNWTAPFIYLYDDSSNPTVEFLGSWSNLTNNHGNQNIQYDASNNLYSISFNCPSTTDLTNAKVIFRGENGGQQPLSGGFGFVNGHVYTSTGDSGDDLENYVAKMTAGSTEHTYTVYFNNAGYFFDNVSAYAYTGSGEAKNADWPGVPMTYNESTMLYEATFTFTHNDAVTPKIIFTNKMTPTVGEKIHRQDNQIRDDFEGQTNPYTLATGKVYIPGQSSNYAGVDKNSYTATSVSDVYAAGTFTVYNSDGNLTNSPSTNYRWSDDTSISAFKFTPISQGSTVYKLETNMAPSGHSHKLDNYDRKFYILYSDNRGLHRYKISGDDDRILTMTDEGSKIALNEFIYESTVKTTSPIEYEPGTTTQINKHLRFNEAFDKGYVNLFFDKATDTFWFELTDTNNNSHKNLTVASENKSYFDFISKSVYVGSTQKVRILNTPSKQVVDAVTLTYNNGQTLTATAAGNGYYSFEMPAYDATISVTFRNRKTFTVSTEVNDADLGSVVVSASTVKEGNSVTLQANPAYVAQSENKAIAFTNWAITGSGSYADGYSNTDSYIEYVPTSDITFTATFTETSPTSWVNGFHVIHSTSEGSADKWYNDSSTRTISGIKTDSTGGYFEVNITSSNGKLYFAILNTTSFDSYDDFVNGSTFTDETESPYSNYASMSRQSQNFNANESGKGEVNIITLTTKNDFTGAVRVYITDGASSAKKFKAVPRVSTLTTASTGGITVYAKDGTLRASYQKYSSFATTTLTSIKDSEGETKSISGTRKTVSGNGGYNLFTGLEAGDVITIRTKLDDGYFNKYYVKAFCINGVSYSLYGENEEPAVGDNARTTGTYTMEYTVTGEDTYLEITPIYFFLENGGDYSNLGFIKFRVENFTGDVQKEWGNTISCQVWYTNGRENNANGEDGGYKNALGGYPGQPLISAGTYYYTQVPKSIPGNNSAGSVTVQGMTLNNYYWDTVHHNLAGKDSTFKGVNNTRSGNAINSQSYDYNDFAALAKMGANDIIFTMKYETKTANKDTTSTSVSTYQNGFHGFVDYFDRGIDLFGHILHKTGTNTFSNVPNGFMTTYWDYNAEKTYSESEIEADNNELFTDNQKLWIVSRGYQAIKNTYNGYYGNYATVWDIYTRNGNTLTKVGSLPSSCLIPNATLYTTVDGSPYSDLPTSGEVYESNKQLFLSFCSTETARSSAANAYFDTFVSLYNTYRGVPAMISYEKAIAEGGVQNDMGLRSDGRWYYSAANINEATYPINPNPQVAADLRIQFRDLVDSSVSTTVYNQTFTTETLTLTDGKAVGGSTGAKVWFTDPSTGAAIITDDDSNNRLKVSADFSDEDSFVFKADSIVVNNGKVYAFRGWQVELADITPLNKDDETSTTGSALRNANNSFIARYEQIVATDTVIVSHEMLKTNSTDTTAKSGGSGTTYVSVEVQTSTGGHVYTYPTTDASIPIDPAYLTAVLEYKFKITLSNEPDETSHFVDSYKSDGTTELSSQTFTLTREQIFAAKDSNNIVKYLTDFAVNTLSISFNYYDRPDSGIEKYEDVNFPREITINVNYENGQTTDQIIAAAMTGNANAADQNSMVKVGNIRNIMDNYIFWTTQNKAATEFAKLDNLHSDTTYGSTPNVQIAYHTDCHGNPVIKIGDEYYYGNIDDSAKITSISDSDKWVSYTLAEGASLDENGDQTDPSKVTKVTLWAFNYPKTYTVTYHYPKLSNSELAVLVSGSTINEDGETNLPTNVYFVDPADSTNPIATVTSYYQQRVGAATNDEEIRRAYLTPAKKTEFRNFVNNDDNLTQAQRDHIATLNENEDAIAEYRDTLYEAKCTEYINEQKELIDSAGGHISQYGVSIGYVGAKYTGGALVDGTGEIRAASVAKYDTGEKDSEQNAIYDNLVFDGWYDAATGKKVSSSELYGYRINVGMNLYAGYVVEKNINTNIGVTVTQLEDDNYIVDVAGGTYQERTRYNTQLNVYNSADNNSSITDTAVVYVQLPITSEHTTEWWAGQFANDATLTESLRNSIQTNLSSGITNGKLTVRSEEITWSSNTVSATVNESGFAYSTSSLALDNKNSVHYTVSFRDDLIEEGKANSAIVVFAGIKYNGNWIVSENAANHINAEVQSSDPD